MSEINETIGKMIQNNKELKAIIGETNNALNRLGVTLRVDTDKQAEEAYQRGYDKGYADRTNNDEVCDGLAKDIYQRGLDDAWEAARKIVCDEELDWNTLLHIFNRSNFEGIFRDFSPSGAIDKLKSYKEKQKAEDEIKVGDEVIYNGTTKCIVVRQEDDERYASLIDGDGTLYSADHRECKKTGRHFDIQSILEEMRT